MEIVLSILAWLESSPYAGWLRSESALTFDADPPLKGPRRGY